MACRVSVLRRLLSAVRPTGVRPTGISFSRWKSSSPTWCSAWRQPAAPSSHHVSSSSRLRPQWCWNRGEVLVCRNYAGDADMSFSELQQRVINVLKMFDKINPDKVTLEAHFVNDLGLDSLDVVEIVMAFEDEFAVEIDDEQAEKIFTPADAVEFLKTKLDIH